MKTQPINVSPLIVIPARYHATRLPAKLLEMVAGKPLIKHSYDNAKKSGFDIIIATDDKRIADVCQNFGAQVCLTKKSHRSGTMRIAEVVEKYAIEDARVIVNVQGDEPMLPAVLIKQVASNLVKYSTDIATLKEKITNSKQTNDASCVKVVVDYQDYALYFSRAKIPHQGHGGRETTYYKHIGLYAYRASFIKNYAKLRQSALERCEKLEQLSALWYGFKIHVATAKQNGSFGIDTLEDLIQFRRMI